MIRQILDLTVRLTFPLVLVMAMWLVFLANLNYNLDLEQFGLRPHLTEGLAGIFTMPFLHENMEHLFSNTIPILVAGGFLFYYFESWAWLILGGIWAGSGTLLWFIGESGTNHIGASGLVYGLVFFLLVSGIIRGHRQLAAVALLMVFLYGSLVWGLFPDYVRLLRQNISWEGHLGGAVSGTLMAILLLGKGPKKDPEPEEETENEPEEYPYWMVDESGNVSDLNFPEPKDTEEKNKAAEEESGFRYRYIPKSANPWEGDEKI